MSLYMNSITDQTQNDFADTSWFSHVEGQLLVDVIETKYEIIVRSAIAGVVADDLDITLTEDTLTIRGTRHVDQEEMHKGTVHAQECHWGAFSRSILLPHHVDPESVDALLQKGVLTIRMKKVDMNTPISVIDLDEE